MSSIQETPAAPEHSAPARAVPTLYVVIGVIAALAVAALVIWFTIWAARTQAATVEALRDIFIIALALETCIFGVIIMLLLIMMIRLVNTLEFEIKPILQKTNETVSTLRGTTVFVSENVVKPVTTASSYVAGVRRGVAALFGDPRRNLEE
jgi:hypothetical protein